MSLAEQLSIQRLDQNITYYMPCEFAYRFIIFQVRYGGKSELATGDQGRNCFFLSRKTSERSFRPIKNIRNRKYCNILTGNLTDIGIYVRNL